MVEPLFRRPCIASVGCNPFSTSYGYVDTVFNAMNNMAIIASKCGGVDELHAHVTRWHDTSGVPLEQNYVWAYDACILLFGVIFPREHTVAKPVVPDCYARAGPLLARAFRSGKPYPEGGKLHEVAKLLPNGCAEGINLWKSFSTRPEDTCPWKVGIKPLLTLILKKQGSHEQSLDDIAEFRSALNILCSRAAWLAYSEDGATPPAAPNPACNCKTAFDVRRPTLDPVFFTQGANLDMGDARGALVGLQPFQYRQLLSLMLGVHLPGVDEVQVVRNEGGLLLRESSLATILKKDGTKRSAKGIAPTQTDTDQAAYGGRRAKCFDASKQMEAWDRNAILQAPLYCAVLPPASREWRSNGQFGDPSWLRSYLNMQQQEQQLVHADETTARSRLEAASNSKLAADALRQP